MVIDAVLGPNRPTAGAPKQPNMKALERIRETGRHAVGNAMTQNLGILFHVISPSDQRRLP